MMPIPSNSKMGTYSNVLIIRRHLAPKNAKKEKTQKGSEMCSLGGNDLTPEKTPKKDSEKEDEGGDEKIDTKKDDEKITTRKDGNSIFLIVTPGERLNYLAIRFSRYRAHDPYI